MADALSPAEAQEENALRLVDALDRPRMTILLVGALLAAHVAAGSVMYERGNASLLGILVKLRPARLLRRCGAMDAASLDQGELWRLVSASFLHVEGLHLLLNALALLALGRLCEAVFGPIRLLWLFLVAGAGGASLSWLGGNTLSVGASSAVFGLMGAAIVFGWKHRGDLPPRESAFFRWRLLPWLLLNLAVGVLPFIDNLGHVGGLVSGAVLSMVLGNRVVPGEQGSALGRALMLAASLLMLLAGALGVYSQWS